MSAMPSVHNMTLRSGRKTCFISKSDDNSLQVCHSSDKLLKSTDQNLLKQQSTFQLRVRRRLFDALEDRSKGSFVNSNGSEHQLDITTNNRSTITSAVETGLCTKEARDESSISTLFPPLPYVNEDFHYHSDFSLNLHQNSMARTMYDKHANFLNGDIIYSDGNSVIQRSSSVHNERNAIQLDPGVQQFKQNDGNLSLENKISRCSFSRNNKTKAFNKNQLSWDVASKTYSDDEEECDNSVFEYSQSNKRFGIGNGHFIRKWLYFGLSKPTHWDVENLSKLNIFGKKKVIFLLLLPLILYLLIAAVQKRNTNFPSDLVPSLDHSSLTSQSYGLSSSWDFIKNLTTSFVSLGKLLDKDKDPMSEDNIVSKSIQKSSVNMLEIKTLLQQFVFEELDAFQLLQKQQKEKAWVSHEISQVQSDFSVLQSEFKVFMDEFKSSKMMTDKKSEIPFAVEAPSAVDIKLKQLSKRLHFMELKFHTLDSFVNDIKNCCRNESKFSSLVQHHMVDLLGSLVGNNGVSELHPFRNWLFLNFVSSGKFTTELKASIDGIERRQEKTKASMEALRQKFDRMAPSYFVSHESDILSEKSTSRIEMLIKKAILMYDADKTGQTDYALESGGGSIISTRCSETYNDRNPRITILGFPLWYGSNSPRNAIQPGIHPGQCWAFKGTQGYLVIQLAAIIRPTGFVIEHIPKSISPSGSIASAPKDFSVYGLESEKSNEGKLLGTYFYDKDGDPLQYFPVQVENTVHYNFVELKIHSNHGDLNYTCLYRFRVHGFLT